MLERKIIDQMRAWKERTNGREALLVEGARRVGKSTSVEQFARECYRSYLLVDFSKLPRDVQQIFEDERTDLDTFIMLLSAYYRVQLYCPALMVAGLLLCCFAGQIDDFGARGFLISAAYYGFTLYLYITLNAVCFRYGAPAEWLFGITRAACILVCLPASSMGDWLNDVSAAGWMEVYVMLGSAIFVLVLLSLLLIDGNQIGATWGIKASSRSEDSGESAKEVTSSYLEDRMYRCALIARHFGLTHREEEVLSLLSEGRSFQDIERDLSIAHGTLRVHVQHVYAKLGVHSAEEAREVVETWKP
jgi:DNA-binding CsgD family transcriptional regulator